MIARQLLTVEVPVEGNEYDGVPDGTFEFLRKIWGEIRSVHDSTDNREAERSGRMEPHTTIVIKTQYFDGYNSGLRFTYNDRVFNVESVINNKERNRQLEWSCTERR